MDRFPNFDLLRLLVALEVVIAHSAYMIGVDVPLPGFPAFVTAVPAFLAISGVLVLKSREGSIDVLDYSLKRVARLLPALIVSLLVSWALYGWVMASNSTIVWLSGGLWPLGGPANGPLWSLLWEEIAYVVLVLLWLVGGYRHQVVIWAFLAVSLAWSRSNTNPALVVIVLLPIAFFIGNLMYLNRKILLRVHWLVPTALMVYMLGWGQHEAARLGLGAEGILIAQVVPFIWFGMAGPRIIRFKLPDVSYGLYVYHWPVVAFLVDRFAPKGPLELAGLIAVFLIPFAVASWFLVESPMLKLPKKIAAFREARPQQAARLATP